MFCKNTFVNFFCLSRKTHYFDNPTHNDSIRLSLPNSQFQQTLKTPYSHSMENSQQDPKKIELLSIEFSRPFCQSLTFKLAYTTEQAKQLSREILGHSRTFYKHLKIL